MNMNVLSENFPVINVEHIIHAIKNARIETEPFTYMVCDNVFHPADYENILQNFPDTRYFSDVAPKVSRLDLVPDPASIGKSDWDIDSQLPPDRAEHQYWFEFRQHLLSNIVMNALAKALTIKPIDNMSCSARLAIDRFDAGLGPHTDRTDKLMSAIFYLADEKDQAFAKFSGTQVLVPNDPNKTFTQEHYTFSDFKIHEYVEYKPNRLFCFAVANGENDKFSFHGYHQNADFERRTIKYHIHNPVLVDDGIRENKRFKSSASNWIDEIKTTRNKGE